MPLSPCTTCLPGRLQLLTCPHQNHNHPKALHMLRLLRPCLSHRQDWTLWASLDTPLNNGWGASQFHGLAQAIAIANRPTLQPADARAALFAASAQSAQPSAPGCSQCLTRLAGRERMWPRVAVEAANWCVCFLSPAASATFEILMCQLPLQDSAAWLPSLFSLGVGG